MSFRKEEPEQDVAAFPDRVCEVCGRKGGGHPNAGLDNVVLAYGHELCGHHSMEFYEAMQASMDELVTNWVTKKRSTNPERKTL